MHQSLKLAAAIGLVLGVAACRPAAQDAHSETPAPAASASRASDDSAPVSAATTADRTSSLPIAQNRGDQLDQGNATETGRDARGFHANGFSPAWRAEIEGATVKLDVPDRNSVDPAYTSVRAESVTRTAHGVEVKGHDGGRTFLLTLDNSAICQRASDENGKTGREYSATLRYGEHTYSGCADRR